MRHFPVKLDLLIVLGFLGRQVKTAWHSSHITNVFLIFLLVKFLECSLKCGVRAGGDTTTSLCSLLQSLLNLKEVLPQVEFPVCLCPPPLFLLLWKASGPLLLTPTLNIPVY